jgi:hypothetical protein
VKAPNVIAATTGAAVSLLGASIIDAQPNPNDTRAAFIMGDDGFTYQELTIAPVRSVINAATDWIFPRLGNLALYEVMVTSVGSSLEAGSDALGSWLPLGTEYRWSVLQTSSNNERLATLTVQVRLVSTGAVLDSGAYTINAVTGTPP